MKKLISMAAALSVCLTLAGGAVSADTLSENFKNITLSAAAADDTATEIDDILPKKFSEMKTFIEANGTVSAHGNYLVFCGNICNYSVMSDSFMSVSQIGEGGFENVTTYQITDDGYDDGSGNVVCVFRAIRSGNMHFTLTCSDDGKDGGGIQCLIDRDCHISEDLNISLHDKTGMENLIYREYSGGYSILKAHEQLKGKLDIPEKIGDVDVSAIPENFLRYYDGITSVTLPSTISKIPESAFELCYDMESITILDPDCRIDDSPKTISNAYDDEHNYTFTGTIYGYKNSTAQKYAKKYGYSFKEVGTEIDDILPKTRREASDFCEKYGSVSVHGKYVVAVQTFMNFYDQGGPEMKGFETTQKGDGSFKLVKCYDMGDPYYYCDANIIMIYEAETAGDVQLMAVHNRNNSGTVKNCMICRKYTIADDLTVTEIPKAENEQHGESTLTLLDDENNISIGAGCNGMTDLIVPSNIMDYKVVSISEDSYSRMKDLKTVVIPETIETICPNVLSECPNLEKVTILNPKCVIEKGEHSFNMDMSICNYIDEENGWKRVYNGVICGYKGSTAEEFAKERGYKFEAIDEANGDVNGDGELTVADVVLLQKWLLGSADADLPNIMAADLCSDGVIDVYDLCVMRKKIVEASAPKNQFINTFEVYDVDTGDPADKVLVRFSEYITVNTPTGEASTVNIKIISAKECPIVIDGTKWSNAVSYRVEATSVESTVNGIEFLLLPEKTETVNGITRLYVHGELVE